MAVVISLMCGHVYRINERPRVDEVCIHCKQIKLVLDYWAESWHSQCKECAYHKTHGFSRKYADESAVRHTSRTGHRTVVLWYVNLPDEIRTRLRENSPAPETSAKLAEDAAPPF